MRHLLPTAALLSAAFLCAPASAQDGGVAPPAPPAEKKPAKEPARAVASRIEEALRDLFAGSAAARTAARASLEAGIAEWQADAKEDPLRAVKWWKGALAASLDTSVKKSGIFEEKIPLGDGKEARIWLSVPRSHGPKTLSPLLLTVLAADQEPKKALPALYGDLLKEWAVLAVVADPKAAGFDIVKEPWLAALGLGWAVGNLRLDRDRVVLDAAPVHANLALNLGAEWAVHFSGVVLRAPTAVNPLVPNLGLCGVALVEPATATDAHRKSAEALKAAVPAAATVPAGEAGDAALHKWIAELPPRRISKALPEGFSWRRRAQEGEPWGYWLWVFRSVDARRDRLVTVTLKCDAAKGIVDLESDNLAEGILLLNDDMVDLDREVVLRINGKEVWKGRVERSVRTAVKWIGETGERTLFAPAEVRFTVPADAIAPKKAGGPPPAAPDAPKAGGAAPADPGAPPK